MSLKSDGTDTFLRSSRYRQYAYLSVTSTEPLGHVADLLGHDPERYWDKDDDHLLRNERTLKRRFSRWTLESRLAETDELEAHLLALLEKLEPRAEQVRTLAAQHQCSIVCVVYGLQNHGFRLPPDLLGRIAAMNVSLELDGYDATDPHDVIVHLRSLVGAETDGYEPEQ